MADLKNYLQERPYPGRGIILGKTKSGNAVEAYFIMGRSENSRNRIFVSDGGTLRTKAFDESKMTDPSLIIYAPVRVLDNKHIVTNGDQTDTIYKLLQEQHTFEQALRTREFEPDAPNYTPRISGVVKFEPDGFNYALSVIKSADGNPESVRRFLYSYKNPVAGEGHFIHTYKADGDPLPSFEGEPVPVEIPEDMNEFSSLIWENLNADNKVALFIRYSENSADYKQVIINKNQ